MRSFVGKSDVFQVALLTVTTTRTDPVGERIPSDSVRIPAATLFGIVTKCHAAFPDQSQIFDRVFHCMAASEVLVGPEPGDSVRERLVHGPRAITKISRRFCAREEHALAGKLEAIDRDERLAGVEDAGK